MDESKGRHLWHTPDLTRFFLVPERTILAPGLDPIHDLRGGQRLVALGALAAFACTPEEAKAHLQAAWQASLQEAKQAWLDLYQFSQQTGQALDLDAAARQFREGLALAGPPAEDAFAAGQAFVESVVAAAEDAGALSEDEQKAVFQRVFAQLPELLDQFSDASLARAADDPEAWAKGLHDRVFGEAEARRRDRRRQELADDVRASIATRLRQAGLTPSVDFGREAGGDDAGGGEAAPDGDEP